MGILGFISERDKRRSEAEQLAPAVAHSVPIAGSGHTNPRERYL
jgi:hypothetical protein